MTQQENRDTDCIWFWDMKRKIDAEIQRLGWSKERCLACIEQRYHKRSRLALNDSQLVDLLDYLSTLAQSQSTTQKLGIRVQPKIKRTTYERFKKPSHKSWKL